MNPLGSRGVHVLALGFRSISSNPLYLLGRATMSPTLLTTCAVPLLPPRPASCCWSHPRVSRPSPTCAPFCASSRRASTQWCAPVPDFAFVAASPYSCCCISSCAAAVASYPCRFLAVTDQVPTLRYWTRRTAPCTTNAGARRTSSCLPSDVVSPARLHPGF